MPATRLNTHLPEENGVVFETTEPAQTEAFLADAFGNPTKISGDRANYRFRLARLISGPWHLNTIEQTATTDFYCDPMTEYLVVVRVHGGVRSNLDHDDHLGPGDLSLHSQPGEPRRVRLTSASYTAVLVPLRAAAEAARNRPDDALGPLSFDSLRPASLGAARRWLQTVAFVVASARADPTTVTQPLLAGAATRLLAATLLTTFPCTWVTETHHQDRVDAHATTLSRAIAFIDDNADIDISTADIARAAYVTVRAVQLAFRRGLDTTPTAYLRRVRLERAREELQAASPDDGIVISRVAARWGFADPSRFAARYRATYGEPPSRTLHN